MRGLAFLSVLAAAFGADPDGATIYKEQCALCHDRSAETRAPAPSALKAMAAESIVRSLESGQMKLQGASLSPAQKRAVAEFLARPVAETKVAEGLCVNLRVPFTPAGDNWNGWGADLANTRFVPAQTARLSPRDVPRLKLKWAFAFKDTFVANGQPTVVGGRVFVPSANRHIYSLDAKTGCLYWDFEAGAPVRTAITIATLDKRHVAFFGDQRGHAYALDAQSGELLWKVRVDSHVNAKVVGAPAYHNGRLYVPVTAGEEGHQLNPQYECCSARGALVALDAASGKEIWKTYTIEEEPKVTGRNWAGAKTWGPSGASIWSAPTIDSGNNVVYGATGDNFSHPATKMSDAVVAFDMRTGRILWATQATANDVFNMGCMGSGAGREGCPDPNGPDVDFGSSPILVKMTNGRRVLLAGQKSGVMHAFDAESGRVLWQTRVGRGGTLGGIQWGSATDGRNVYVPVSDIAFQRPAPPPPGAPATRPRRMPDPKVGGGLFALDIETGSKLWEASRPDCGDRPNCSPAQSAAITVIPGVVFSGSVDGHLRAYSTVDGKVIWDFDATGEFMTVNGVRARGGSMDGAGPVVAGGMLYFGAGYGAWGGLPGNVLLALGVD